MVVAEEILKDALNLRIQIFLKDNPSYGIVGILGGYDSDAIKLIRENGEHQIYNRDTIFKIVYTPRGASNR